MNAFATKPARPPELVIAAYVHLRGVDREELLEGDHATRDVTRLRHELMYLLRDLTSLPLMKIGLLFGGRTEATVKQGVSKVADRMMDSPLYRQQMRLLHAAMLAYPQQMMPAQDQTARDIARKVCGRPEGHAAETRALATALLIVDNLLSDRDLPPEDCLWQAQQALRELRGAA